MDAHIIFGVNSVLNDNTCAPSIDALRTTHGDNNIYVHTQITKVNREIESDTDTYIHKVNDNVCNNGYWWYKKTYE